MTYRIDNNGSAAPIFSLGGYVVANNCNTPGRGISRHTAALVALLLIATPGCSWSLFTPPKSTSPGTAHVTVVAVIPWHQIQDQLRPEITLKSEDALKAVAPFVQSRDDVFSRLLSLTFKAGLGSADTNDGGGGAPDGAKPSGGGDGGDAASKKPELGQLSPYSKYTLATALYQELQMLNESVSNFQASGDQEVYLVALDIALFPQRNSDYDANVYVSFTSDQPEEWQHIEALPILTQDDVELSRQSSLVQNAVELSFALSAVSQFKTTPASILAQIGLDQKDIRNTLGRDVNTLQIVGRASRETIVAHFGASLTVDPARTLYPQTRRVYTLFVVPKTAAVRSWAQSAASFYTISSVEFIDEYGNTIRGDQPAPPPQALFGKNPCGPNSTIDKSKGIDAFWTKYYKEGVGIDYAKLCKPPVGSALNAGTISAAVDASNQLIKDIELTYASNRECDDTLISFDKSLNSLTTASEQQAYAAATVETATNAFNTSKSEKQNADKDLANKKTAFKTAKAAAEKKDSTQAAKDLMAKTQADSEKADTKATAAQFAVDVATRNLTDAIQKQAAAQTAMQIAKRALAESGTPPPEIVPALGNGDFAAARNITAHLRPQANQRRRQHEAAVAIESATTAITQLLAIKGSQAPSANVLKALRRETGGLISALKRLPQTSETDEALSLAIDAANAVQNTSTDTMQPGLLPWTVHELGKYAANASTGWSPLWLPRPPDDGLLVSKSRLVGVTDKSGNICLTIAGTSLSPKQTSWRISTRYGGEFVPNVQQIDSDIVALNFSTALLRDTREEIGDKEEKYSGIVEYYASNKYEISVDHEVVPATDTNTAPSRYSLYEVAPKNKPSSALPINTIDFVAYQSAVKDCTELDEGEQKPGPAGTPQAQTDGGVP